MTNITYQDRIREQWLTDTDWPLPLDFSQLSRTDRGKLAQDMTAFCYRYATVSFEWLCDVIGINYSAIRNDLYD